MDFFRKFFKELLHDLTSLRASWCHVYLLAYLVLGGVVVLKYPTHLSSLIYTTGATVSTIFTGYVFSRTWASVNQRQELEKEPQVGFIEGEGNE